MSTTDKASPGETPAQLSIRKGSRVAPAILLLLTIFLFILYALPSGFGQLAEGLGVSSDPSKVPTLEEVERLLTSEAKADVDKRNAVLERMKGFGPWQYVTQIGLPIVKIYLDQLAIDLAKISQNVVKTAAVLALFSLIPGLAGLIYRRNFAIWFLASFGVLLAINASGVFGSLAGAEKMLLSGTIFFFILSQIVLLLLAYRLRRHSQGLNLLPPAVQNWGLTILLTLVGIACWQGWGPRSAAPPAAPAAVTTAPQAVPAVLGASPTAPTTGPSAVAKTEAAKSDAPKAATPAPDAKPGTSQSAAPSQPQGTDNKDGGTASSRSWIWSFLGSGITGWIYKWEFILIGLPLIYTLLRNSAAWTARTPKNIVICLDGTSNTPDQMEMGFLAQTNVFKLFRMLKADKPGMFVPSGQFDASLCKRYGQKQIAFYFAGVGNKFDNDPILQTLGMATGMGAGDIVERAYLDLVRVYQPGDRVFVFGFSRGAAIARLLARTIDARGAPRSVWTLRLLGKHRTLWSSRKRNPVPIDVLGCWDTVGAFGVAKTIVGINFQQLNLFKDLSVPDNVAKAYHMVALDEQRDSFEPTLMDPDPIRPERIVEVWFSGDHANIGGGWATDKLSDITLDFLLRRISSGYATGEPGGSTEPGDPAWGIYLEARKGTRAGAVSAAFESGVITVDPDPLGQVRSWFSNLYVYRPRKLPLHAVISETVFERMKKSVPVYAPQSLFDLNDALDAKRDHIAEKVERLKETSSLSEAEWQAVLEFKDKLRLTRFPGYWQGLVEARSPQPVEVALANAALAAPAKAA